MVDSKLCEIQSTLENADNLIDLEEYDQAIELLKGIQDYIPMYADTSEWVQFDLLMGEALSGKNDPMAEDFLREAEEKAARVRCLSRELRIRIFESLGAFYERNSRTLDLSRTAYKRAKAILDEQPPSWKMFSSMLVEPAVGIAIEQELKDDIDRIELKIQRVALSKRKDSENIKLLMKVGRENFFTWTEIRKAWNQFMSLARPKNAVFARDLRKEMTQDYFLAMLSSVRNSQDDGKGEKE